MNKYALDTNCFINAMNKNSPTHDAVQWLLEAAKKGCINLAVSLHTLHELEKKKIKHGDLAKTLPELDHWPIGSWKGQVGIWKQQAGSWDDGKRNDKIQEELEQLAKSGYSYICESRSYVYVIPNKARATIWNRR
jgi:predicted nucleic acid-binding protein